MKERVKLADLDLHCIYLAQHGEGQYKTMIKMC